MSFHPVYGGKLMTSHTSPRPNNGGNAPDTGEAHKPVDNLIHQLVCLLGKQDAAVEGCNDYTPEEIILDRTVDAVRYLLIRMPHVTPGHAPLSPREHEIVRMVASGHPTKVIAGVLNISCWTVTAHLRRIFTKLGVTSRPAMVARLLEEGRTWDVPVQGDKPRSDNKAFAGARSERPTTATQRLPSVRA
jgi:two-component system, NarL family, nitrate/nitrite response regulator NarL